MLVQPSEFALPLCGAYNPAALLELHPFYGMTSAEGGNRTHTPEGTRV